MTPNHFHVTLVTGRPEANLIPLLQLRPERIALVASEKMASNAQRLQTLLQQNGWQASGAAVTIEQGLPDSDPALMSDFANGLADRLLEEKERTPDLRITYDLTGGTKLMALLFQEAMRCCDADLIYTDSDAGRIYRLGTQLDRESFRDIPVEPVLSSDIYLRANGKRLGASDSDDEAWRAKASDRKLLTKHLVRDSICLERFIGQLNFIIHVNNDDNVAVFARARPGAAATWNKQASDQTRQLKNVPNKHERQALQMMLEQGIIAWDEEAPKTIEFLDAEATAYLGGKWLEEYVWHCARDAGLEDVHCGARLIDVRGRKDDVKNELDLIAVYRNRMLVIECKTGLLSDAGTDSQVLYKLHSLAEQASGIYGTRVLATLKQFGSNQQHQTNIARARRMRIEVIETKALKNLPAHLKRWMDTGQWL